MSGDTQVGSNVVRGAGGELRCRYCDGGLEGTLQDHISRLPRYQGPVTDAGPQVHADASVYIDVGVVFRQYYCPHCYTAFRTEVVPDEQA